MKKIFDRLLDIFMWIGEVFLYSLALPLLLGIIWTLGGVYTWFMDFSWAIKIPVCIIAGLCAKTWINNYLKSKETTLLN